jgi:3-oxoacyl-[acyl-carrier-protein] synthase II
LESAQGRDAKMYAEIVGFGAACDPQGTDFLRPTAGNVGQAIVGAMKQAGVTPDDVDAIVTYGTGVPGEDVAETAEWAKAMGDRVSEIPAVSTTGATGTMFAGQSGVQLSLAAKMMFENVVLPTANFRTAAEGCNLNLSAEARSTELKTIVTAAYTVGGQSAACVLRAI